MQIKANKVEIVNFNNNPFATTIQTTKRQFIEILNLIVKLPVSERARAKEPESKKFKVFDENLDNFGSGFSFLTETLEWECDALMAE